MEELIDAPAENVKVMLEVSDDCTIELGMEQVKLLNSIGAQYSECASKPEWRRVDVRDRNFDPYLIKKMVQLADKLVEKGPENIVPLYNLIKHRPGEE